MRRLTASTYIALHDILLESATLNEEAEALDQ